MDEHEDFPFSVFGNTLTKKFGDDIDLMSKSNVHTHQNVSGPTYKGTVDSGLYVQDWSRIVVAIRLADISDILIKMLL